MTNKFFLWTHKDSQGRDWFISAKDGACSSPGLRTAVTFTEAEADELASKIFPEPKKVFA